MYLKGEKIPVSGVVCRKALVGTGFCPFRHEGNYVKGTLRGSIFS